MIRSKIMTRKPDVLHDSRLNTHTTPDLSSLNNLWEDSINKDPAIMAAYIKNFANKILRFDLTTYMDTTYNRRFIIYDYCSFKEFKKQRNEV